jgi:hypothetical protein
LGKNQKTVFLEDEILELIFQRFDFSLKTFKFFIYSITASQIKLHLALLINLDTSTQQLLVGTAATAFATLAGAFLAALATAFFTSLMTALFT